MPKIIVQNTPITVYCLLGRRTGLYLPLRYGTAKGGDNRSADIIKNWHYNQLTYLLVEYGKSQCGFHKHGMTQDERLVKLNQTSIHQMSVLENGENDRKLLK